MKSRSLLLILFFVACFLSLPDKTNAALLSRAPNNLSLVGYWPMNEGVGTMAGDASGNKNDGTFVQDPDWVNGRFNYGVNLNGIDEYIDIANEAPFDFEKTQAITLSAWVKRDVVDTIEGGIIQKSTGSPNFYGWGFWFTTEGGGGDYLYFGESGSGGVMNVRVNAASIVPGEWHHIAVSYSGSQLASGVNMYIDGVVASMTTMADTLGSATTILNNNSVKIGVDDATQANDFFDGKVDDVRVYRRVLSSTDIASLYKAGSAQAAASSADLTDGTTLESGLVGLWTMDGTDTNWGSNTMTDRSGNGVTGTIVNVSTTTSPRFGKLAQALMFDKANDGIVLPSDPIDTNTVTVCSWIYPTSPNDGGAIIGNGRFYLAVYVQNYQLRLNSNSSLGGDLLSTTNIVATSTWSHVCAVRNSGANGPSTIYLNGASVASGNTNTPTSGFGLAIGDHGTGGGQSWSGALDDVRIYNRALSVSEINQLYSLGLATANASQRITGGTLDSGLVNYWSFDGADINWGSNTALSRGSSAHNGTISGMSTTTSPKPGKVGQALFFDSSNDIITTSYNVTYPVTGCAWVNYSSNTDTTSTIVSDVEFSLYVINDIGNADYVNIYNNNGSLSSSGDSIRSGVWNHVCSTITSGNLATIYINGVSVAGPTDLGAPVVSNTMTIGETVMLGLIDEVRMYNRVLSASEIKTLYNMGR